MKNGIFTISLDFELHWGVFPTKSVEAYQTNLKGTKKAIEGILNLFYQFDIHATWATVGFLFFNNKKELESALPKQIATYTDNKFNPYPLLANFEEEYAGDFHFANTLIEQIKNTSNQEIGTHTFSHYYCLEAGQIAAQFQEDLKTAIETAKAMNIPITSIVFPRNQYNEEYLNICKKLNIKYLRNNSSHFIYKPRNRKADNQPHIRALRLIDAYLNLAGHQVHTPTKKDGLVHIPASRMLRPFHPKLKLLEQLKLNRIKKEMTVAAQQDKLYHLWWHPHNFGAHTKENLDNLANILTHFQQLQEEYNFQSLNMQEVGELTID